MALRAHPVRDAEAPNNSLWTGLYPDEVPSRGAASLRTIQRLEASIAVAACPGRWHLISDCSGQLLREAGAMSIEDDKYLKGM